MCSSRYINALHKVSLVLFKSSITPSNQCAPTMFNLFFPSSDGMPQRR